MGHTLRETYDAIVSDNQDPEKRGRIKVKCGEITDTERDLPEWVEPCFQYAGVEGAAGIFFVPAVGDPVEIERAVGHTDDDASGMATIINPETRWRCMTYGTAADVPTEFTFGTYGKRMGIKTPGGTVLIFDDEASALFLVASQIKIGSETAAEPLVLGNIMLSFCSQFLSIMETHTHGYLPGPSPLAQTDPPDAATVAALQALQSSPIGDSAILSQKVTTE